jgi:hypothetical protein
MSWAVYSFENSEQAEKFEDMVKARIGPIAYRSKWDVTIDNDSPASFGDELRSQLDHLAMMFDGKRTT